MHNRNLSLFDQLIVQTDKALRTLVAGKDLTSERPSPADLQSPVNLTSAEKNHAAGLMRVNHAGEVCAQALYQGQALTAKLPSVRLDMEKAADEEIDHLVWCEKRLHELDNKPSVFNPLWYGLSFSIGAAAGLVSDKISLGFVAATEQQVCKHLDSHLQSLPEQDLKSRAIVTQMLEDEARHAHMALSAGGHHFPAPIKTAMTMISKVMTDVSYKI